MNVNLRCAVILTRNLKLILETYEKELPGHEFDSFLNHVQELIQQNTENLSMFPQGAERGKKFLELLDLEVEKANTTDITCRKGCSSCCHFEVEIISDEASVLAQAVRSGAVKIDRTQLSERSKRVKRDSVWKLGAASENRCLFLDSEGACRVYSLRPSSCRKLVVTSPPQDCSDLSGNPRPILIPLAEILVSSAIALKDNRFGPMAEMLQEKLDKAEGLIRFQLPSQTILSSEPSAVTEVLRDNSSPQSEIPIPESPSLEQMGGV